MADRIEILKELHRRGKLPADKRPAFDEAVKRGLITLDAAPAAPAQPISAKPEPVGVVEDVARSVATGLPKGFASFAGFTGDVQNFLRERAPDVGEAIQRALGFSEENIALTKQRMADADDTAVMRFIRAPLVELGIVDEDNPLARVGSIVPATSAELEQRTFFGEDSAASALGLDAEEHESQTMPGRFARTVSEFVGSGPVKGQMAINVASGLASQTAGELTAGTAIEPFARTLAAIAGGFGAARATSAASGRPVKLAQEAIEGVTDAELRAARELERAAENVGVRLSAPEAIAHVQSKPNNSLLKLMGDVASSRRGGAVIEKNLGQRADQVKQAATSAVDDAAGAATRTPEKVGDDVKQAAENLLQDVLNARSKTSGKFFEAAKGQNLPDPNAVNAVAQNMRRQAAQFDDQSKARQALLRLADRLTPNGKPITDAGKLFEISKDVRDVAKLSPAHKQAPIPAEAAVLSRGSKQVREVASQNPNVARGRQVHREISAKLVDPLRQGQVGALARSGGGAATLDKVNDILTNPNTARPETIEGTLKAISRRDQGIARNVAATYLRNNLNAALKGSQAGDKTMAGVKFKQRVMGTPQQVENLEAIIKNIPGTGVPAAQRWEAFKKVMDVLDATGKLPAAGSATASRTANLSDVGRPGPAVEAATNPFFFLRDTVREMVQGRNLERLAKIFTQEDSVAKLRELARLKPVETRSRLIVAEGLGFLREVQRDRPERRPMSLSGQARLQTTPATPPKARTGLTGRPLALQ